MEMGVESNNDINKSCVLVSSTWQSRCKQAVLSAAKKVNERISGLINQVVKIGRDDPRRIAHSIKVGLALTLVSVFYYVTPLFAGFGVSTMWAVLTVVVVMEYTVGGTLSKGMNRAFATLLAGALGVGAHQIALHCGNNGEPVVLGIFVFILGAGATFSRFIPEIKARYDYGVTIFILTFSLVTVSSYRVDELTQLAHQRVSTIAIGVAICLGTSIFVCPVWAGQDLHNLVASNMDKLATFMEGLGNEYFGEKGVAENEESKTLLQVHRSVLNSKPTEDSLANFARCEPPHGSFSFRHPWKQYLTIGVLNRQCASSMEALATYISNTSAKNKSTSDPELRVKIRNTCKEMSTESAKALRELAISIRLFKTPSPACCHVAAAISATGKLKSILTANVATCEIIHVATTASLLAEIVTRTQDITGSVIELGRVAHFQNSDPIQKVVKMENGSEVTPHTIINVESLVVN